ncbi:hypothetical protein ACQJ22_09610 [Pseudomonas fragariae (ex Marin et al. 2024)]|uniref:Uncharacterized protein n=1 Tax=Pseudomonas syringae pv. aceris TaxID=199198 RepID=A0A0L8IWE3_PSESX|nr:hypothetical protein [Pseudomonas syringae]AKF47625.1 hypothetical protein PsyrB_20855 [Pseudomonas syringae pv. syringae B301D]EGH73598.1 hypothetical protein PSYAR_23881 [Pseudomonas syringae pv. aceris str. M302273]EXL32530.1 hypothetical protein PssB301D_01351 [Pseudomonas syringae pv. syringae str. B301D-R]KOG05705.1 Uncharacterized protein ABJ98_0163 [Pseudomonas syringae pv. aceris]KPW15168.1 Uncharacterized protein ALO91_01850 [Pseudomonas syringae pv. aceris]
MTDPLDKATSTAPATLGEGCLSRYDPAELTAENGTDFDGAAALWRELQQAQALGEGLEEEGGQEDK